MDADYALTPVQSHLSVSRVSVAMMGDQQGGYKTAGGMSVVNTDQHCLRARWTGSEYGNSDRQLVILPVVCTVHFNINIFEYFSVLHKCLFCQMA